MSQATDPTPNKLKRKDIFYFDLVVFQVEDTLFKLPKGQFAASSVFATIFTLPPGEKDAEGTEDKPFVLHGISEVDFESLSKVMYPPPLTLTSLKLTRQEWISVLKLSTMWEFTDIRGRAIQELGKKEMGMEAVEKIACARRFEVKEWFLDGCVELLKRVETITNEEAERLGLGTAVKLLRLREKYLQAPAVRHPTLCKFCSIYNKPGNIKLIYQSRCPRCSIQENLHEPPDRKQHDFTSAIREEFQADV